MRFVLALVLIFSVNATALAQEQDAPPCEDASLNPVPQNLVHYDLQGKRLSLSDFVTVEGAWRPLTPRPVILIFGAHWCVPCKGVMAQVHQAQAQIAAIDALVIYLHIDDLDRSDGRSAKEIRELVRELASGPHYSGVSVLLGGDLSQLRTWTRRNNDALPGCVFIAPDGGIRATSDAENFAEQLSHFLAAMAHDKAKVDPPKETTPKP